MHVMCLVWPAFQVPSNDPIQVASVSFSLFLTGKLRQLTGAVWLCCFFAGHCESEIKKDGDVALRAYDFSPS